MSMLATFVQVEPAVLDDASRVESLFEPELPPAFDPERMREAILTRGPQVLAGAMELHPQLREQIEQSLGRTQAALRDGEGGEALFALMQERLGRPPSEKEKEEGVYDVLSLDKAWHGVHYVLSGSVEPDDSLLGQAVLGGTEIGEDFSGYGAARCFTAGQVEALAALLADPHAEEEASDRYDPQRMTELHIYPFGWDSGGRQWILESFRKLRGFYSDAAANGRAVVTCLV
jgi:Domain of unknown function (DUF1877)